MLNTIFMFLYSIECYCITKVYYLILTVLHLNLHKYKFKKYFNILINNNILL